MHWIRRHARGRPPHPDVLTPAEWRVLEQVRAGYSNPEIAERLGITVPTVKTHMTRILAKLDLPDRRALATWDGQPATVEAGRRPRLAPLGWLTSSAAGGATVVAVAIVAAVGFIALMESGRLASDGGGDPAPPEPSPTAVFAPGNPELTPLASGPVLTRGTEGYAYRPQLAYVDDTGTLWRVDADGSGRTRLLDGCGESVTWSADGRTVYCIGPDGSVQSNSAEGDRARLLVDRGCLYLYPSPDGARVVCQRDDVTVIVDADGRPAGTIEPDMRPAGVAWSPTGRHLVYQARTPLPQTPGGVGRVAYHLSDADGVTIERFEDAFGHPLAWTLDGMRLALVTDDGLQIYDLPSGDRRTLAPDWLADAWWGAGPRMTWVHDDTALLLDPWVWGRGGGEPAVIDVATGERLEGPGGMNVPWAAPDGVHAAVTWPDGEPVIAVADLEQGTSHVVPGFEFVDAMMAPGPLIFSGDSRRLCWFASMAFHPTDARPVEPVLCMDLDDGELFEGASRRFAGKPPFDVPVTSRWRELSPDLAHLATVGEDGTTLDVAAVEGGAVVDVGPVLTPFAYAWRTDGVLHPPQRIW